MNRFFRAARSFFFFALIFFAGAFAALYLMFGFVFERAGLGQAWLPLVRASLLTRSYYVDSISSEDIRSKLLSGLVNSLDPHSTYLPPKDEESMLQDMQGSYGGIGITAKTQKDKLIINDILLSGPAARAKLRKGDSILAVDGEPVAQHSIEENFSRIRGPFGSQVRLTVLSNGDALPRDVLVSREAIHSRSVQSVELPRPDGTQALLIKVKSFSEQVEPQLLDILESLPASSRYSQIILDLRDNPGGLIQSAVGLSSFFLPANVEVVSARERDASSARRWLTRRADWARDSDDPDWVSQAHAKSPWLRTVPMTVLVNRRSASASEIVAGALRDHHRALIVGNTTFGKGSVQSIFSLGDAGSIKITTSRYYTPSGKPIQAVGVTPDVLVASRLDKGLREADLPNHLKGELGRELKGLPSASASGSGSGSEVSFSKDEQAQILEQQGSIFSSRATVGVSDPYVQAALKALASAPKL